MNLDKHFIGNYKVGVWDCWTLAQDMFKQEHNIDLPDFPHMTTNSKEFKDNIFTNVLLEEVKEPQKGLMVYYVNAGEHHAGYVINDKEYIHRPACGTRIDNIKPFVKMYRVKGVKYD